MVETSLAGTSGSACLRPPGVLSYVSGWTSPRSIFRGAMGSGWQAGRLACCATLSIILSRRISSGIAKCSFPNMPALLSWNSFLKSSPNQ